MSWHWPTVNACWNALSATFLILGYLAIKKGQADKHRICMIGALVASTLFLAGYLYYHANHGSTKFQGQGVIRTVYFTVLISHTILATAILPLIIRTVYLAWRGNFEKHRKIAKITFPLWAYVSVTGVIVYWMLYRIS